MTNMRCIRPSAMALGEGPVWSVADQALHYVDIKQGHVHRLHSPSGSHGTHDVGGMPSFIVPTADSGHIVGSGSGLHHLHDGTLSKAFVTIPQPDHNRTNDATVAPDGRLWFGTMDNNERQPTGRLWCLDRGTLRSTEIGAIVTNGPAFSRDGQWLYHVDSVERTIWRHEMRANGMPGPGERFVQLHPDEGHPDGIFIDAQVGRQMQSGVTVIQRLAAAGTLRHIVIIGLGTNGDVTAGQIRQLRQAIGPNRDLILVNTFGPMPWEREDNAVLDAAGRQSGHVELANWNQAIAADPSLLWPDGIHPQPSGAKLYARVVLAAARTALSRDQPSACPRPH